ncbi:MAG: nucleotidyltransferase family protein [Candidatus Wallbacteria bacterium]|nr:nucleotidyltransferase family protein [Candidatus Wallbacteria bacterium]
MPQPVLVEFSWDRLESAVAAVKERLLRATAALDAAGVAYAVIGGNAVAAWVARVDASCVRNTADVDLLLRRSDFEKAKAALSEAGFRYRHAAGIDMFLDGDSGRARDAVHIIFAGEKVRPEYAAPAPDVDESEAAIPYSEDPAGVTPRRILTLEALVRMKLTSFRDKDRTHIRDMLGVGLIDETWCDRLPAALAERLLQILANPEG